MNKVTEEAQLGHEDVSCTAPPVMHDNMVGMTMRHESSAVYGYEMPDMAGLCDRTHRRAGRRVMQLTAGRWDLRHS